jgi:hypothetical protein
MPGDMADVVQIPIEASCAIQHSYSIYNCCMYSNGIASVRNSSYISCHSRMDKACSVKPDPSGTAVASPVSATWTRPRSLTVETPNVAAATHSPRRDVRRQSLRT